MSEYRNSAEGDTTPAGARGVGAARYPLCLALALLLLVGGHPSGLARAADDDADARLDLLFGEHDPYRNFFHALQAAVASNAHERLAAMIRYPLKTHINRHVVQLRNPHDFIAHYDELLSPTTRDVIAHQSFETLFANSQGVMIGNGQVWFSAVCKDELCSARALKITAFNPDA